MRLGIPYMGSKRKIASEILKVIVRFQQQTTQKRWLNVFFGTEKEKQINTRFFKKIKIIIKKFCELK